MNTHSMKIWSCYYQPLIEGRKTFERRETLDRVFQVGDLLNLHEYEPDKQRFTGRHALVRVTYILDGPLALPGEALMSIELLNAYEAVRP